MFISIIHEDKQQFLVNINCKVIHLLCHLRNRLQLPITDIIDLCDGKGSLKLLFLVTNFCESAANFLTPRDTYYICKIVKGGSGSKHEHCYKQIIVMLSSVDPEITDVLKSQCDLLEKSHLKILKTHRVKQSAAQDLCVPSQQTSGGSLKSSEEEIANRYNNTRSLRDRELPVTSIRECESDNTKFMTSAPHSHLRPYNTNKSYDTGKENG